MTHGDKKHDYLRRLEPERYRGDACVHWSMTMDQRATGWLKPVFLYRFREILTHTCFRYRLACLVYVLMPDHLHMLWHGLGSASDQRKAIAFFRRTCNQSLRRIGFQWQPQAYDRVLCDEELQQQGLRGVVEYIARNPERSELVPLDGFADYPYLGCVLPGYPDLKPFEPGGWDKTERILSKLRKTSVFTREDGDPSGNDSSPDG